MSQHALPPAHKLKIVYAFDSQKIGFFWAESTQKRDEALSVQRNAPSQFESVYQGRPGQREGSIFLSADLDNFFSLGAPPLPLSLGIHHPAVANFTARGHAVIQAWDTAFSTSSQAAHTACVTALLVPCTTYHCNEPAEIYGPCDSHFDVLILDVFRERVDWGGLVDASKRLYHRWKPLEVLIEKKASGISLITSLRSAGLPITEAIADESKSARAINSIGLKGAGSAQGWFRQHRVLVPDDPVAAPWLAGWRTEMKDFSGEDDASSDRVDATVHLIRRAIMLGSTSTLLPSDWEPSRSAIPNPVYAAQQAANAMLDSPDPRAEMLATIALLPTWINDESYGLCASCSHYQNAGFCAIHRRKVTSLDSCEFYTNAEDARSDSSTLAAVSGLYQGHAGKFPVS